MKTQILITNPNGMVQKYEKAQALPVILWAWGWDSKRAEAIKCKSDERYISLFLGTKR